MSSPTGANEHTALLKNSQRLQTIDVPTAATSSSSSAASPLPSPLTSPNSLPSSRPGSSLATPATPHSMLKSPSPQPTLTAGVSPRRKSLYPDSDDDENREEFLRVAGMDGYIEDRAMELRFWIVCALTCFTLWIFLKIKYPNLLVTWRYKSVPLNEATMVLVHGHLHGSELVRIEQVGSDIAGLVAEQYMHTVDEKVAGINSNPSPYAHILPASVSGLSDTDLEPAINGPSASLALCKMILWRHMRFIYSPLANRFIMQQADVPSKRVEANDPLLRHTTVADLTAAELNQRNKQGLTRQQWHDNLSLYGENALNIEVPSFGSLLFQELMNPFYMFQAYSIILWAGFEEYYAFSGAIFVIVLESLISSVLEQRHLMAELASLARFDSMVTVLRDGTFVQVSSSKLVPGDVVNVSTGILPCDMTLIEGSAVVNESVLTGESVPVVKSHVQWPLDRNSHNRIPLTTVSRHTLFSATKIVQLKPNEANKPVLAVVVRTAFATTKGSLILSILYPRPSPFKFVEQSYKFIGVMFVIALIGFLVCLWQMTVQRAPLELKIIRGLDLITIAVPPSLPLALSVGTMFALRWLRGEQIFCISPARINMAGKINTICLDKTGTLTEESLVFMGVYGVARIAEDDDGQSSSSSSSPAQPGVTFGKFQSPEVKKAVASSTLEATAVEMERKRPPSPSIPYVDTHTTIPLTPALKIAMACCQSLAVLDEELIGDPLEQQTFQVANASLQDSGDLQGYKQLIRLAPYATGNAKHHQQREYGVQHQFEFSSALQRQSVLVTDTSSQENWAFVKGSPEMMETLCLPETIPSNYKGVLSYFAHSGYRVIAIGRKRVASVPQHMEKSALREFVEKDLVFLGLIVLENKLKPESEPTLALLRAAGLRLVIVSGDHLLTCCTVAKDCKLVEPGVRLFQSHLIEDKSTGAKTLEWRDTNDDTLKLEGDSLRLPREALEKARGGTVRYELAVTGPAFQYLSELPDSDAPESYFKRVVLNAQVFARMSPDQKAHLIAELQSLGCNVCMTGDGANDCGALKTAHVGVSLSESEASIAAPFTYKRSNISCLPILLSEGRSSLTTSFQLFRYMAMYSMIQFGAVVHTYFQGSVIGNWQYLYQDLFIVLGLSVFMGATQANRELSRKRPSGDLLSGANMSNLFLHISMSLLFQFMVYRTVIAEPDFVRLPNKDYTADSMATTALYYFSNFEYIIIAFLFSLGRPWKANIFTNWKFTAWVCLTAFFSTSIIFFTFFTPAFIRGDDVYIPMHWKYVILAFVIAYAFAASMLELVLFPLALRFLRYMKHTDTPSNSGWSFGRKKLIEGPGAKRKHRIRGKFQRGWDLNTDHSAIIDRDEE